MNFLATSYLTSARDEAIKKAEAYIVRCGELAESKLQSEANRTYFASRAEEGKEAVRELRAFKPTHSPE